MGVLYWSLFWHALLCVLSSFAIIMTRKRELVALQGDVLCLVTVNVQWLFFMVLRVGLQCAIVVFLDHTHLLFASSFLKKENKKVIKAVYSCSIEIIKGLTDKELR